MDDIVQELADYDREHGYEYNATYSCSIDEICIRRFL